MKSRSWRASICLAIATLATVSTAAAGSEPAPRARLLDLVRHDCGSCHGLTLNGGLGPALTPAALAEKPDEMLVATILHGRAGTPMPPWKRFLSEDDVKWVVAMLKKGLPNVAR